MASLGNLFITVGADISGFSAAMGNVNDGLHQATKDVARETAGWADAFSSLQTVGIGLTAAITAPLVGIGLASVTMSEQINMARLAFTTMLGSAEQAGVFLDKLKSFAAATPFEFPELVTAAKRMMAMGFEASQVIPMLRTIGDFVAGMGGNAQNIDRVTLALGQMQAKGKVSAQEMNQLAENGVKAWELVANAIGKSIPEAMKLAENGAISASISVPAILQGMNDKFGGQMEKVSKTLTGVWSNFKDQSTFVLADIGNTLAPVLKDLVTNVAMPLLNWVRETADAFAHMDPFLQKIILGFVAFAAAAGPLLLAVGTLGQAFIGVQTAIAVVGPIFTAMGASLTVLLGPVGLAVAAVAALGVAAFQMYQHWADIKPVLVGLWTDISSLASSVFGPVVAFLAPLFNNTIAVWTLAWTQMKDFLGGAWASISGVATAIWGSIVDKFNVAIGALGALLPATAAALKAASAGMYDLSASEKEAQQYAESLDGKLGKIPPTLKLTEDSAKATKKANDLLAAAFGELGLKTKEGKTKLEAMEDALKLVEKAYQAGKVPLSAYITGLNNFNDEVKKEKLADLRGKLDKLTVSYRDGAKTTAEYTAKKKELTDAIERLDPVIRKTAASTFDIQSELVKLDVVVIANTRSSKDLTAALNVGAVALAATLKPATDSIDATVKLQEAYKSLGINSTKHLEEMKTAAIKNYEMIRDSSAASDRDRAIAHDAMITAIKKGEMEATATTLDQVSSRKKHFDDFAKQVSTIFTDFSRDIVKSLFEGGGSIGDKFKDMLKSMGEAVLRMFIEPATAALTDFMTGVIKDLLGGKGFGGILDGIKNIGSAIGSVFGSGGGAVGDIAGGVSAGLPGGALGTIGGAASAGTSAAGAAGSVAGMGVSAITGMVTGIVSAVSGVIGNFQFMAMNKSLDLIEHEVRFSQLHLFHTLNKANEFWPKLDHLVDIWGAVNTVRDALDFGITDRLNDIKGLLQLSAPSMEFAGAGSGVYFDLRGAQFLNQASIDDFLDTAVRRLKERGA